MPDVLSQSKCQTREAEEEWKEPMSEQTLLEKAKAVRGLRQLQRRVGGTLEEEVELALAWAEGTISATQGMNALGQPKGHQGSWYSFLAMRLRDAVRLGVLVRKGE
jgi:hypothetical protein